MSESTRQTARISVGLVLFSFAVSGLTSGVTMAVVPKLDVGPVMMIIVMFLVSHTLAANSLGIDRGGRLGVGFATGGGTLASFPPFIGTQAMKGTESFGELSVQFGAWFVIAFLLASAIGLSTLSKHGWKVVAQGVLGFCTGAAINGAIVALAYRWDFIRTPFGFLLMGVFFCLPGLTGGATLAWALNSRQFRTTENSSNSVS